MSTIRRPNNRQFPNPKSENERQWDADCREGDSTCLRSDLFPPLGFRGLMGWNEIAVVGMNLIKLMERFPDQAHCISRLESIRPQYPLCQSNQGARKRLLQKIERWNCRAGCSIFNVLSETIFQNPIAKMVCRHRLSL
ncbi:MAG: hypothetical protein M2R45_02527 [Verrucomicrobia subdivision 3 bacterium]|nr:hypothetical protein [Limisphaerales bacterium]MCS1414265.1 hypothetical protein [Limisphaerales bacterium]